MVAVIAPRIDRLRVVLGTDAGLVHFVDMAAVGHNPALIIPGWREFAEEGGDRKPMRGISERIWSRRRPAEVAECQLHETLLNVAVDPHIPLWLLCPYDVLALPADVITEAKRSHPVLVEVEERRSSTLYGGSHHAETLFEADLPPVDVLASHRNFGRGDLQTVREDVIAHALGAGLSAARSADLALAVYEVAANSVQHGCGQRDLSIGLTKDSLVCEIHDYGRIADPMTGRRTPAVDDERGRGLWIANHLCDLVKVRSSAAGTTIRIHTWI
jgi:anti-sigma regulatory factor (Ser/Thr protein kinase)